MNITIQKTVQEVDEAGQVTSVDNINQSVIKTANDSSPYLTITQVTTVLKDGPTPEFQQVTISLSNDMP